MHHRRAARSQGTSWAAALPAVAVTCLSLASLLILALGATALAIGASRPTTRSSTVAQPWTSTTTFGWSGTAADSDIYPDGQVQSPQPVFLRLLTDITVTADVATSGALPAGSSGPLTLRATLGDDTGWSRTWALDRATANAASPAHLSAPLRLNALLDETSWNHTATGVQSPVSLTLSVDSGQPGAPAAQLKFSLDQLLFKPLGPVTASTGGSVSATTQKTGAVRLAGHSVTVASLRRTGVGLVGGGLAGLIVAGAAALAGRRRRTPIPPPIAPVGTVIPGQRSSREDEALAKASP